MNTFENYKNELVKTAINLELLEPTERGVLIDTAGLLLCTALLSQDQISKYFTITITPDTSAAIIIGYVYRKYQSDALRYLTAENVTVVEASFNAGYKIGDQVVKKDEKIKFSEAAYHALQATDMDEFINRLFELENGSMYVMGVEQIFSVQELLVNKLDQKIAVKEAESVDTIVEEVEKMFSADEIDELIGQAKLVAGRYKCDKAKATEDTDSKTDFIPHSLKSCLTVMTSDDLVGKTQVIKDRDDEIFDLFCSLSKQTKSNAIMIGKPGVGKTAVVEEMARQIVNKECPQYFEGYTILSLDVNGIVSGTKYRGELENKLEDLVNVLQNTPNCICFIDEIHKIVNAGQSEGSANGVDSALKPFLARSQSKILGATTIDEFEHIIRDGALERRFDIVTVEEPTQDKVYDMVEGRIHEISEYHGIKITKAEINGAIEKCTSIKSRAFPDKVIDVVDYALSASKMKSLKKVDAKSIEKRVNEMMKKKSKNVVADKIF